MDTKTLLTIKTDKRLKAEAQKTAEKLGLPLGTVINAMLKQLVRDQAFTVSMSRMPSKYLEMVLEEAEEESIRMGSYSTKKEALKKLQK